jgi:hypothetical protein
MTIYLHSDPHTFYSPDHTILEILLKYITITFDTDSDTTCIPDELNLTFTDTNPTDPGQTHGLLLHPDTITIKLPDSIKQKFLTDIKNIWPDYPSL